MRSGGLRREPHKHDVLGIALGSVDPSQASLAEDSVILLPGSTDARCGACGS